MFERILSVKYITLKNSFIYLPTSFKHIKAGSCIQLTHGDNKVAYFSISTPRITLDDNSVGLNAYYAKTLGIDENELVTIAQINQLPTINSLTISPISSNDFDMLEILAETIQTTLLDQIRVVYNAQKFVLWLGSNISVPVLLENVKPVSPGIIDFLTEVAVKPNSDKTKREDFVSITEQKKNVSIFDMEKMKALKNIDNQLNGEDSLQIRYYSKEQLVYRLVPLKEMTVLDKLYKHSCLFNVFVSKEYLPKIWLKNNCPIFCSISLLTNDMFSEKIVYVKLCILENFISGHVLNLVDNLFVSDTVLEILDCHLGSRVLLKYIDNTPFVNEINIYTKKNYLLNIQEKFKIYLAEHSDDIMVLNPDIVFNIGDNIACSLKFSPIEAKFCVVDDRLVRNCKYIVHHEVPSVKENRTAMSSSLTFLENIANYSSLIKQVDANFSNGKSIWENVLITGKAGTGKSTLVKIITEKLRAYPNFIYIKRISCKTIKGKMMDSLVKVFSNAFSELVLYQPSVLILDDLHVLCESIKGDEMAPNAIYYNRISEMLYNFFKLFQKSNRIGICATADSISKLNKNIYFSRGCQSFKNIYTINDLTKGDRVHLLEYLFKNCDMVDVSLDDLSVKMEGFVVEDIVDFYNKASFESYKDGNDCGEKILISGKHCETALKKTCVLALQNVQLHPPGSKDFSDIGGLHHIKKLLIESLMWPAQYPKIFANAPLRLQSGLLLYGPPGTGKTLLAAAAAKHCGLRLISIKGPELLSKYIGASEQAVRDVFQKAQSARPCILFFDEFDSLAPRRGHDNTGVTDRVVNQLLTQLDGVESLTGVCVLAATSRPDLLDPALLRPGRLDRQILCPLPDQNARLEIFNVLSKNLVLSNVNLDEIALLTEGYSGADLQSILYTAQLSTIDNILTDYSGCPDIVDSQITMEHVKEALCKTRPSLPKQERMRYEKIYAKFQGKTGIDDFNAGSKATLA